MLPQGRTGSLAAIMAKPMVRPDFYKLRDEASTGSGFKAQLLYARTLADRTYRDCSCALSFEKNWIPACAGMTNAGCPCGGTVTVALPLHARRHQLFNNQTKPCQGDRPANLSPTFKAW